MAVQKSAMAELRIADLSQKAIALDHLRQVESSTRPRSIPPVAQRRGEMEYEEQQRQRPDRRRDMDEPNPLWAGILKGDRKDSKVVPIAQAPKHPQMTASYGIGGDDFVVKDGDAH
jgi:hypothetical protein